MIANLLYYGIIYDTIFNLWGVETVSQYNIVLDTNVLVAALRSQQGASYQLLMRLDPSVIQLNVSVPVVMEYEDVLLRFCDSAVLTAADINDILDYLCSIAQHRPIFYLWRPFLKDPQDDMILELAVVSQAAMIITFNIRDFQGVEQFGIQVLRPQEFLKLLNTEDSYGHD